MTVGFVSGFVPVPGNQSVVAGTAAGDKPAATDSPLGMFEALLALVGAPNIDTSAIVPPVSGEDAQASLGALLAQQLASGTGEEVATLPAATTTDEDAETAPDLLADLIDQLTALQDVLGGSAPVDPAAEKKLAETIDALAAALGIQLPQAPSVDPAITAAASIDTSVVAGPQFDPAAVVAAATTDAKPTTETATLGAIPLADDGVPVTVDGDTIQATAATTDAPATDESTTTSQPVVKELADKLTQLAAVLAPKAPELAKKLEALSQGLASGTITAEQLAKLGLDLDAGADVPETEIARAIDRLLSPAAETKPAPTPAPFTAATMALPELSGDKSKTDAQKIDGKATVAASAKAEPDATTSDDVEIKPASTKAPERSDKIDAQPAQRSSVHSAFQASLANDANAPQPAQTTAPAPAVVTVGSAVAADAKAMHAAYKAPVQQINMPQMAVEIVRQVEAGNSRFQIRLDPPELGRVDVKLDVDKAGNVSARMTVERAETLDLMQRDQRSLEKALAQAGLDSSKTNLEFSLRQSPFGRDGQSQQQQGGGNGQPTFPRFGVAETENVPAPHITAYRGYASASGVNLFV